jgi:hypothetical protein
MHVGKKDPFYVQHPIGSHLPLVLHGLAKVCSSIKCGNACICIKKGAVWEMKGCYSTALHMDDALPWVQNEKGNCMVSLKADINHTDPTGLTVNASSSLLPSALPADVGSLKEQLMNLLDIPESLTVHPKAVDLHLAYAKYQSVLDAQSEMQRMLANGTWPLGKVSGDNVIEIFISKSVYYGFYLKLFPWAINHRKIIRWLENDLKLPDVLDVFGVEKAVYHLKDLKKLLDQIEKHGKKKRKLYVHSDVEESSLKRHRVDSSSSKQSKHSVSLNNVSM